MCDSADACGGLQAKFIRKRVAVLVEQTRLYWQDQSDVAEVDELEKEYEDFWNAHSKNLETRFKEAVDAADKGVYSEYSCGSDSDGDGL